MGARLEKAIGDRTSEVGAEIIVLPLRFDDTIGKAVYSQTDALTVKRLRQAGVNAAFLHDSDDRVFESLNSAILAVAGAFALGLATNAAYDALKRAVKCLAPSEDSLVTVRITDATKEPPATFDLTGTPSDVVKTIQQLEAGKDLSPTIEAPIVSTSSAAGVRELPPSARAADEIRRKSAAGTTLMARAKALHEESPRDSAACESIVADALKQFRSALDWAEDTDREEEMHRQLDEAGLWKRRTLGCTIKFVDGKYIEDCPVSLGHRRVGLSVGGTAISVCSICARDFSECEHDPAASYLVPGGQAYRNYCRVCAETECAKHKSNLQYSATPVSIVTKMQVNEVSIVARPAFKDARITESEIGIESLRMALGPQFTPGVSVSCDKCLSSCGGLVEVPSLLKQ